jgi:predicted negative regulator of RcsB-dependent stress response
MTNKPLLGFIVVLLLAIAGYLSYLAWDRHQHNLAEHAEQQKALAFDAALLGTTPQKLAADRAGKASEANQAIDASERMPLK